MGKLINLTGQRFGGLTVIGRAGNNKAGHSQCWCQCDCGEFLIVDGGSLKSGDTQSCGCLQREQNTTGIAEMLAVGHYVTQSL